VAPSLAISSFAGCPAWLLPLQHCMQAQKQE
jgi:hypothetical protein